MLPLIPNPHAFTASHPEWLTDVADLVFRSRVGTTFGLYGRWGSGKSSAALALVPAIYAAARQKQRVSQVVIVDATSLRGSPKDAAEIARAVNAEVTFEKSCTLDFAELRRKAYQAVNVFAKAVEKVPDPVVKVGAHSLDVLSAQAEAIVERAQKTNESRIGTSPELDQIFVVFDDLDRCSPDIAIRVLETAVTPTLQSLATTMVVCDPGVLAAHAATVFGVPLADGLRAISKYIHVAIHVPARTGPSLREALLARMPGECTRRDELANAAQIAAEIVPIRDVLMALPQSALWARAFERRAPASVPCCRMLLALSVLSTALPQVFEVIQRSPLQLFRALLQEYSHGETINAQARFRATLGEAVVRQLEQRVDLVEVGQRLGGAEIGADDAQHIWGAINGTTTKPATRIAKAAGS